LGEKATLLEKRKIGEFDAVQRFAISWPNVNSVDGSKASEIPPALAFRKEKSPELPM
jgi:hypothetical protein